MADALVVKGLSKRFGGLRAVQDVSFTIQEIGRASCRERVLVAV